MNRAAFRAMEKREKEDKADDVQFKNPMHKSEGDDFEVIGSRDFEKVSIADGGTTELVDDIPRVPQNRKLREAPDISETKSDCHNSINAAVWFSPDAKALAVGGRDTCELALWDLVTESRTVVATSKTSIRASAVASHGPGLHLGQFRFAVAADDGMSVYTIGPVQSIPIAEWIAQKELSHVDGLEAALSEKCANTSDLNEMKDEELDVVLRGLQTPVKEMTERRVRKAFNQLQTGGAWHVEPDGWAIADLRVTDVAFSLDGNWLAIVRGKNGLLEVIDIATSSKMGRLVKRYTMEENTAEYFPACINMNEPGLLSFAENFLAIGGRQDAESRNEVLIMSVPDFKKVHQFKVEWDNVPCVLFCLDLNRDGKLLAIGLADTAKKKQPNVLLYSSNTGWMSKFEGKPKPNSAFEFDAKSKPNSVLRMRPFGLPRLHPKDAYTVSVKFSNDGKIYQQIPPVNSKTATFPCGRTVGYESVTVKLPKNMVTNDHNNDFVIMQFEMQT